MMDTILISTFLAGVIVGLVLRDAIRWVRSASLEGFYARWPDADYGDGREDKGK